MRRSLRSGVVRAGASTVASSGSRPGSAVVSAALEVACVPIASEVVVLSPELVAAIVAGVVSVVLAVMNLLLARRQASLATELEETRAELARRAAEDNARLDYQYDAKRRLYERFEPLVFQLLELSDYALDRIKNLTDPSVWPEFAAGEEGPPGTPRPPMAADKYETVSTLYGLYSPLVVIRSMSRSLTWVDLALEPRIQLQYHLASRLYGCIKDDKRLSQIAPPLAYAPFEEGWREKRRVAPATYWWQGLTMGRLETILDLMTAGSAADPGDRLMSFGEFERFYSDVLHGDDERPKKTLAVAANAVYRFRPGDRPVFWRMLIAQARLYQALLRTRAHGFEVSSDKSRWAELLRLEDQHDFEWQGGMHGAEPLSQVLGVTDVYLQERVYRTWMSQWTAGGPTSKRSSAIIDIGTAPTSVDSSGGVVRPR
jgi:hypothetical protein